MAHSNHKSEDSWHKDSHHEDSYELDIEKLDNIAGGQGGDYSYAYVDTYADDADFGWYNNLHKG